MAYIGNIPAEKYISISSQTFTTINGTGYTLSSSVTNSEDIALFLNNVRQKPSTYTATGTSLTMGTATTTADELYCVYLGKGIQTVTPGSASVGTAQIADLAVTTAKLDNLAVTNAKVADDAVGVDELSATGTASASTYLRGDNSWAAVAADTNDKVSVSADDTTPGYLNGKLVAGTNISLTEGSGGGDETLTAAFTGNLAASVINTGLIDTARLGTGTASSSTFLRGDQTYAEAGGGKVAQVVQTVDTTIRSATVSSYVTTNISVTITPTSATSKILLDFSGYMGFSTGMRAFLQPYVSEDGGADSAIAIPGSLDGFAIIGANDTATYQCQSAHVHYLHSPATTNELVYTMYVNSNGAGAHNIYIGEIKGGANNTCPTFFTATEILA
tara:strand:- start:290 stop:1453 length:1164 start_codon:yes stop_codon:yes gene_type:complete